MSAGSPALRHVVLGKFTDEATTAQKEAMLTALRGLPAKIPEICSLVCGMDVGIAEGNHDFSLNVEFTGPDGYQVYATHPDHVAVITDLIKPILKPGSRTAVQFTLPPPSTALKYYIFGHPVLMSPSPDIHNVGFSANGLPHRYERYDTESAAEVIATARSAGCGGGSVTIPHKESVMAHLDELTDAASTIGAVNTLTQLGGGRLRGDNTDWIGIRRQLEAKAPPREDGAAPVALICGAGGTARAAAYALQQMGAARVLVYNRTPARAEQLAADFGSPLEPLSDLALLDSLTRLDFVVCTLPGSSGFVLPPAQAGLLLRFKPTCLEAAYIPRHTAFVRQALLSGCRVVEGVEMLFEQGCAQCVLWTGQPAPRAEIAANLLTQLFGAASTHPAAEKMEPREEPPDGLKREVEAQDTGSPLKKARL